MGADGWVDVEVDGAETFPDVADGAAIIALVVVRFVAGLLDVPAALAEAAVFAFFFAGILIPFLSRR